MSIKFFGKTNTNIIRVDVHSHLLPGVDDGVQDIEETFEIIRKLKEFGFEKCIITPHIYPDLYPNNEKDLKKQFQILVNEIEKEGIEFRLELAAEYFLHEEIFKKLRKGDSLLTFGQRFLLFETGFLNKPVFFDELMYELKSQGYQPVMAHPERYHFVSMELDSIRQWKDQGILMQMNSASLIGAFGITPKKIGRYMIKNGLVDFFGSDLHSITQIDGFRKAHLDKWYRKASGGMLINNQLD